jgi:hypothetical protein
MGWGLVQFVESLMIDLTNTGLYRDSLAELRRFKTQFGRSYLGRFVQLFLALKFFENGLPSMFSGQFVSTELLQTLIDDLYTKRSQDANEGVLGRVW